MNSLAIQPSNSFHANLALAAGLAVTITAETLDQLAATVAKLQGPTSPGGVDKLPGGVDKLPGGVDKVAADKPKVEAKKPDATTAAPASAQPAASGSEPAADTPRFTYDDVKARVLGLSKVKRELAIETLGAFKTVGGDKVDHGNKLQLEDYAAFIAAADKALGAGK